MTALSMHETQQLLVTEPAWLVAVGARLWVTRHGDPHDHVLGPGDRLSVACGDRLVVGPWEPGDAAAWSWQPSRAPQPGGYGWRRRALAPVLALAARVLRGAADGLADLARSAAAMACRAQGCIKAGDSMASAGTVQ
jgi:hypothetical protein